VLDIAVDLVIRLFAVLRERAGTAQLEVSDLPDVLDVAGLKKHLSEHHPELGDLSFVRGVLGTRYVEDDTNIEPGADFSLLPPVSGGVQESDEELESGVFELRSDPIDTVECSARVAHNSCGANLVFTGSTRDSNRGREVTLLDYDAFEAMSGPEMKLIFDECRAKFGSPGVAGDPGYEPERRLRMLCQHRTGVVEVGGVSVVIAVASPHRDLAFEACRFLIDTLKERLPVWKKEVYLEGEHWIGDRS
jgi:molybdopterin synthase catalytic subunit/molybdopterin converting factor small subunit